MPVTHLNRPLKNALSDTVIGSANGLSPSASFLLATSGFVEALLQIRSLGGTAASATCGCRVQAFRRLGPVGGMKTDTVPMLDVTLPTSLASAKPDGEYRTFSLPGGDYEVKLQNLDTTVDSANAVTVSATLAPIEVRAR